MIFVVVVVNNMHVTHQPVKLHDVDIKVESKFNPHETARYGEIASAILNFFVCCMEMG